MVNTFNAAAGAFLKSEGTVPYRVIPIDSNANAIGTAPPSMYCE